MNFTEREFIESTKQARAEGHADIRGAAILICLLLAVLAFLIGFNEGSSQSPQTQEVSK